MSDDNEQVRYWLCCGSKIYPHGAETCYEARSGHPERVRFGTAKEHSEWQQWKSSNRLLGAKAEYERQNPLGGPATMFEVIASRIRAGEPLDEVMRDYGLMFVDRDTDA